MKSPRTLRVWGDSNAVGYRKIPDGTKKFLSSLLERKGKGAVDTVGRTRLTVLPSEFEFVPWCKETVGCGLSKTDFALVILGTNDITHLRRKAMEWSEGMTDKEIAGKIKVSVRKVLSFIRQHTKRKIVVLEPVNEMPKRASEKAI